MFKIPITRLFVLKKDLSISILSCISAILYIFIAQFSLFAIIIFILCLFFIYLYFYKNISWYLFYILIFIISYIFMYFIGNGFPLGWILVLLLSLIFSALTVLFNLIKIDMQSTKMMYFFLISLFGCEIMAVLNYLNYAAAAKALFLVLVYYLLLGTIREYNLKKLNLKSILQYGGIFVAGFTLLLLRINYIM